MESHIMWVYEILVDKQKLLKTPQLRFNNYKRKPS